MLFKNAIVLMFYLAVREVVRGGGKDDVINPVIFAVEVVPDHYDIVDAVTKDDLNRLKEILKGKSFIEKVPLLDFYYKYETPLEMAVKRCNPEMVRGLLEEGALAMVVTFVPREATILHTAAVYGDAEIMGDLLAQIDDEEFVNRKDPFGGTAIAEAVRRGNLEMVEKLVDKGGKVTAVDICNDTVMHYAAKHGNTQLYEYLKRKGAGALKDSKNGLEQTPLMLAAKGGNVEMVKALLKDGVDADASSLREPTALYQAVVAKKKETVEILLKHGVDMNKKTRSGVTPMDIVTDDAIRMILKAEEERRLRKGKIKKILELVGKKVGLKKK